MNLLVLMLSYKRHCSSLYYNKGGYNEIGIHKIIRKHS